MLPNEIPTLYHRENFVSVLTGENLHYNFHTQQGHLDNAQVRLPDFNLYCSALTINGKAYTAHHVEIYPGGLTPEEMRIYGRPPISLRASTVTATTEGPKSREKLDVQQAGLYLHNFKILPVPSYLFRATSGGGARDQRAFQLTPRLGYNTVDGALLTTEIQVPIIRHSDRFQALADVGISQRVGFRGGAALVANSGLGTFTLQARKNDIVTTQLTNRLELDRLPEIQYVSPVLLPFRLPGKRLAGFRFVGGYGRFVERTIGAGSSSVRADRATDGIYFSTRFNAVVGPYVNLFATNSSYSGYRSHYGSYGYEIGYAGDLLPRVRGQVSFSSASLSGSTPFQFDLVEIARELRTTFDIQVSKRYLVPIDLRYDLSQDALRDETYGLLRSYKTFAYGIVYQRAHKDLRLELRDSF